MLIALATTTIHVPHALKLMRKCSSHVKFFVAGDKKSPHDKIVECLQEAGAPYYYLPPKSQTKWKCSEALGFNTLARRNVAFLEALKWGADVIYSWDSDNIPVDCTHFWTLENHVFEPFNGIKVSSQLDWFDPGLLLIPPTRHRGYPYNIPAYRYAEPVTDARIGVAAGLIIGDPDIDATTRMEHRPDIGQVHLLGQTGVVVDPHTWTVFNTQNTAVLRELVPAWFLMPGVGRHDDIYASLIVQRVARERDLHVHFGPPFTYQQRNEHNPIADLRAEIDGMENVTKLADLLDAIVLPGVSSVIEQTRIIYKVLLHCDFLPKASVEAGLIWLEDVEMVL